MSTQFKAEQQNKLRRSLPGQRKEQNIMKMKSDKLTGRQRMPKRNTVGMPNETALHFIELVKRNGCLWNPLDRQFRDKERQEKAWKDVSEAMGFSVDELKDKWVSLKSSFRAYQLKFASEPEKARKWFAFDAIKFLATSTSSGPVSDAGPVHHHDRSTPTKEELVVEICKDQNTIVEYYAEVEDDHEHPRIVTRNPGTGERTYEEMKVEHYTTNGCVADGKVQSPASESANDVLDRSTIFGQSVSVKLKCLDRRQQMLAEKIISDVMFEAELGNLTTAHVWDIQQVLRNLHASRSQHLASSDQ